MRWWLERRDDTREDATFFTADEVGYGNFSAEFQRVSSDMARWKSNGTVVDLGIAELPKEIMNFTTEFPAGRLLFIEVEIRVQKGSGEAARSFGIELSDLFRKTPWAPWTIHAVGLVVLGPILGTRVGRWLRPVAGNGLISLKIQTVRLGSDHV